MVGKTISHYTILERLGEGGMGVVYKAEDSKLKRTVALKFLPHGLESHEPERARLLQEAQAAATLNHPNICTIYDIAEAEDQQFIVMEYVEGTTLREKMSGPGVKVSDVVRYGIQICEALEEAHSKGVVHRDIKTENIMINTKNQVKVMDFGLAKLRGSLKLSKTSSTVGTLAYMAPEQIEGGAVDARSDLFSFGVVLYEMLTGQFPFRGEHEAAILYSIVNEEPDPIQKYRPDVPSEFLHVINRALEKDPEERYQSAHDMLIDLRRLRKESSRVIRPTRAATPIQSADAGVPAPPAGPARRTPWAMRILAGAVLLTAAVILVLVLPSRKPTLNPNFTQRTLEIPVTGARYPSLSRDGNWAAFGARDPSGRWAVYFMNVAKRDPKPLTEESYSDVDYVDISPDASEILHSARFPGEPFGIYLVSTQGGNDRKIVEIGNVAKWHPDGQRFGYIRGQFGFPGTSSASGKLEFWTARRDGGDQRLEFIDSSSSTFVPVCFDWSPDGASIAWLHGYSPGWSEIMIHDLTPGSQRQLTSLRSGIDEVTWCTNDQILFSSSKSGNTNIWMVPSEGGEPAQVTRGSGPDIGMRVSGDAKRMLFLVRQNIAHVWTADIDGRSARQQTYDNCNMYGAAISPSGGQILFAMGSSDHLRDGSQVFLMQCDGTNRRQITSEEGWNVNPTWSPDGRRMTYASCPITEPFDSAEVCLIELANPGVVRHLGKGFVGGWPDTGAIALVGRRHTSLYSIREQRVVEVSEDSTWRYPLQQGKQTLIFDRRRGTGGVWLTGSGAGTVPRQVLGEESIGSAAPSSDLKFVLYLKPTGELWRVSIPEGRHEPLPPVFHHLSPRIGAISTNYGSTKVVFLKSQSEAKLVLVEDLFE